MGSNTVPERVKVAIAQEIIDDILECADVDYFISMRGLSKEESEDVSDLVWSAMPNPTALEWRNRYEA